MDIMQFFLDSLVSRSEIDVAKARQSVSYIKAKNDAILFPRTDAGTITVAFDLSLVNTGIGVLCSGERGYSTVTTMKIKVPKALASGNKLARLDYYAEFFRFFLDNMVDLSGRFKMNLGLEGYAYGCKGRSVFDIAEQGGAFRLEAFRHGITPIVIPPTTLKKFVAGKGNVSGKAIIMKELFRLWGVSCFDDNEADAAALAIMAFLFQSGAYKRDGLLRANEVEALVSIEKELAAK